MTNSHLHLLCESIYQSLNQRKYLAPDPLELVVPFSDLKDREVAGFISSSLALGRASAIVSAADIIISRLGSPHDGLLLSKESDLQSMCRGFAYRFFRETHLYGLLLGMRRVICEHGSIENCIAAAGPLDVVGGLTHLVDQLLARSGSMLEDSILVAHPGRGSACKRLLLYLRWMVRHDRVDPGGWSAVQPAQLLIPLDTHMLSVAHELGLTRRKQATLAVSREITNRFCAICPEDPVRYDFALTRLGIHPDLQSSSLLGWIESTRGQLTR